MIVTNSAVNGSANTLFLLLRLKAESVDLSRFSAGDQPSRVQISFPCGLLLVAESHPDTNVVLLYGNRPEIEHTLQHLFLHESPLWRADRNDENRQMEQERWRDDAKWNIFRQDDAGNVFRIYNNLSETEARCMIRLFEERGHKQLYWAEHENRS